MLGANVDQRTKNLVDAVELLQYELLLSADSEINDHNLVTKNTTVFSHRYINRMNVNDSL